MANKVTNIHVKDSCDAFNVAARFMPGDWEDDRQASARAGYPVYRCYGDGLYYNYICDLGNRLEVNLGDGSTVNVWIDDDAEEDFTASAPAAAAAPAAVADGDGLQGSGVNSAEGSAAAGAIPAEGSDSAATDPRPACWVISDGLEDGERITVELISCETGELRKYETLRAFLDEWAWWHSGGRCIMNDDKIATALRGILDVGHGARVSLGLAGFELVFTFYRWPGYDRFMRPVREVA